MEDLQAFLNSNIPLARAMELRVLASGQDGVVIGAPLAANINHIGTAFGGSESSLAILAAWSLLYERLKHANLKADIIIQRNSIHYIKPVNADFVASAYLTNPADWQRFVKTLQKRGQARINISSNINCNHARAAHFEGDFVATRISHIV
jgi:thioesterase domain-containing protein